MYKFAKQQQDVNAEKRKKYLERYHKSYKRPSKVDVIDEWVKEQHKRDTHELSFGEHLSDLEYWKWNRGAYKYSRKTGKYRLDSKLCVSGDISKYVHMNEKLRPQKYRIAR
jgi:hypothetical protein